MNSIKRITAYILPLFLLVLLNGCDKDEGTSSQNHAPTISNLTANPPSDSVDLGEISTLSVTASDPDGDLIEIVWETSTGTLDTLRGSSVVWTAPEEANQSVIFVYATDEVAGSEMLSYTFDFSSFAPGPPTILSVHATPGHGYIATSALPNQWFLELYTEVLNGATASQVIRVTAESPSGQVYNLRDDGFYPDTTANDYRFFGFPSTTIELDTGYVYFTAYNQYFETVIDSFEITELCDTIPTLEEPDSVDGDVFCYQSITPQFIWNSYTNSDNFQVWVVDTTEADEIIWLSNLIDSDTSIVYGTNPTATGGYMQIGQDYLLYLKVNRGNSWAKREQWIRRIP